MLGLESMGMVHPEWQFNSDVDRLIEWPDIYMQGVAYRFRAFKAWQQKKDAKNQIKSDLKKSILLLTESGARIELAHAQVLMARIRIDEDKMTLASKLLKKAWDVFSKINPDLFPQDLKPFLDQTSKNALWVESLLDVSEALTNTRTKEELLNKIIRQVMLIAGAERGAIFLLKNKKLELVATRNIARSEVDMAMFSEHMASIRETVVSGKEVICNSQITCSGEAGSVESRGWTGCFPIGLKSIVLGVIFIDQGPTSLQLPEDEIALLQIISNQAAVALENMEAYEEIIDLNHGLEAETQFYRHSYDFPPFKTQMIGHSEPFRKMLVLISRVANSDTTVMITGETGVGKDVVAQPFTSKASVHRNPLLLSMWFL